MNLKGHAFVSKFGEGFTTLPELAKTLKLKDGTNVAVAAPGVTGYVQVRHLEREQKIWGHLLDLMEEYYSAKEVGDRDLAEQVNRDKRTVMRCLALLRHGTADDGAMRLIAAEARKRYELESE